MPAELRPRGARHFVTPHRWLATCTACAGLLGVANSALAYRPFDGTDADIARPGEFELELGPAHFLREGDANFLVAPAMVLNLGLTDRLELVSDFKNVVRLGGSQVGSRQLAVRDDDVMVKAVLRKGALQGQPGPSIAVETGVLLPETADSGFGAAADAILSLASTGWAFHFNETIASNREHRFELFSSAIVEAIRSAWVHPVGEVFIDHIRGEGSSYSALLGAVWSGSEQWTFDTAFRTARTDGVWALEARLGFTWTMPVWTGKTEPRFPHSILPSPDESRPNSKTAP
jgi:hypothetical protein